MALRYSDQALDFTKTGKISQYVISMSSQGVLMPENERDRDNRQLSDELQYFIKQVLLIVSCGTNHAGCAQQDCAPTWSCAEHTACPVPRY